jgi:hypothetical protein
MNGRDIGFGWILVGWLAVAVVSLVWMLSTYDPPPPQSDYSDEPVTVSEQEVLMP